MSPPGRPSAQHVFTKPRPGSKIVRHVIAVTTVSIAHGHEHHRAQQPLPLNALCMAIAMARPRTSSRITDATVKMSVCRNAAQNSAACSAVW